MKNSHFILGTAAALIRNPYLSFLIVRHMNPARALPAFANRDPSEENAFCASLSLDLNTNSAPR